MNERTPFFIKKIYLSHFILLMLVVCEKWVGDGDRLLHINPSSSDHSSTYFVFWLGCSTVGPSDWSWLSIRHPVPNSNWNCNSNWLKPSVAPGYIIFLHPPASCGRMQLPPSPNLTTSTIQGDIPISSTGCTCFTVLPLIYTGASLDWRLGRESICYTVTGRREKNF